MMGVGRVAWGRKNDLVVRVALLHKGESIVVAFGIRNAFIGVTVVGIIAVEFLVVECTDDSGFGFIMR
mgnify:CR=1 FL=1